ncbi:MAG: transposase [Candidatus Latescibacteria bacterium]|nr:transposase [Candidatus Latescibacterota bacterium]
MLKLQEGINTVRQRIWRQQDGVFRQRAVIDIDGTHVPTDGECKAGLDLSYTGIWGYAPLVIALDNTREILYLVNRPGNTVSHQGAVPWIDRAITLVKPTFTEVWLRGDTDVRLTEQCDRWDAQGVRFVFGFDTHSTLVTRAEGLPPEAWQRLERPPAYVVKTRPRKRPPRVKAERVRQRGFKNLRLEWEEVADFPYRPTHCQKPYRMVVLRKHLVIEKGGSVIDRTVCHVFSMTNDGTMTPAQVVAFSNDRCDEENTIEQLKNWVRAFRCPGRDLYANWADYGDRRAGLEPQGLVWGGDARSDPGARLCCGWNSNGSSAPGCTSRVRFSGRAGG